MFQIGWIMDSSKVCFKFSHHITMLCIVVFLVRGGILPIKWVDFCTRKVRQQTQEKILWPQSYYSTPSENFLKFVFGFYFFLIRKLCSQLPHKVHKELRTQTAPCVSKAIDTKMKSIKLSNTLRTFKYIIITNGCNLG